MTETINSTRIRIISKKYYFCFTETCSYSYIFHEVYSQRLDPFSAALILHQILSTSCWKHCSEIFPHIDMMAPCSCCRFVSCTSMMQICSPTLWKRVLSSHFQQFLNYSDQPLWHQQTLHNKSPLHPLYPDHVHLPKCIEFGWLGIYVEQLNRFT